MTAPPLLVKNNLTKEKAGKRIWEKILQQLYRGDLCPAENTIRGNAEYDALTRQSMDDFNRFTDKLDRDMKEEFDLLMEHYLELTFIEKTQCFTDGFRIGAGVMCEVFYENAAERN